MTSNDTQTLGAAASEQEPEILTQTGARPDGVQRSAGGFSPTPDSKSDELRPSSAAVTESLSGSSDRSDEGAQDHLPNGRQCPACGWEPLVDHAEVTNTLQARIKELEARSSNDSNDEARAIAFVEKHAMRMSLGDHRDIIALLVKEFAAVRSDVELGAQRDLPSGGEVCGCEQGFVRGCCPVCDNRGACEPNAIGVRWTCSEGEYGCNVDHMPRSRISSGPIRK